MSRWLTLLALAYLVGSLPFSWVIVRWRTGADVRRVGSGNVGATNAMRTAGKGAGAASLVLDLLKGVVPVAAARALDAPPVVVACVAATAVLGHVYPVWLGFQGGKGVATGAGALGALQPLAAALSLLVFLGVVAWKRYVSLGSIAAVTSFPLFVMLLAALGATPRQEPAFLVGSALVPALIVWRHRDNVRRLLAGTERRLGDRLEGGAR